VSYELRAANDYDRETLCFNYYQNSSSLCVARGGQISSALDFLGLAPHRPQASPLESVLASSRESIELAPRGARSARNAETIGHIEAVRSLEIFGHLEAVALGEVVPVLMR
jgi:hypothetical protein